MKFQTSYLLFSLCLFCFTCSDNKLKVKNNSSKEIVVYYSKTDELNKYSYGVNILPNSSKNLLARNQTWEYIFEASPDKKVRFYIYDANLLFDKTPKEQFDLIMDTKNCLSKQKFSVTDLENFNWEIPYSD
ncbi:MULTISPECIES: hypothetical protein [Emticicia]|uniref:hypothetical protein n=1 Tax=Emticicia TaxID=312278 RepID=UPI0007D89F61|nr:MULTISPECIES: hypothetical protein [Emticicia]